MEKEVELFRGSTSRWLVGSFAGWMTILLCVFGVGLVIIFFKWLRNISTSYELTSQRLIIRTGIVFKKIDEVELYRIKDVNVTFSLLNQLSDIGRITLRSSDATTNRHPFELNDIPNARGIRETMRTLVDDARKRRRVREVDIDYEG